jgi:uncharacterized protein YjbJ (UPF0337 family)
MIMDAHRITGAVKELVGGAQEAAGAVTGDTTAELRGKARQAEGGAERTYGEWLDLARDLARDRPLLAVLDTSALSFTVGVLVAGGRLRD